MAPSASGRSRTGRCSAMGHRRRNSGHTGRAGPPFPRGGAICRRRSRQAMGGVARTAPSPDSPTVKLRQVLRSTVDPRLANQALEPRHKVLPGVRIPPPCVYQGKGRVRRCVSTSFKVQTLASDHGKSPGHARSARGAAVPRPTFVPQRTGLRHGEGEIRHSTGPPTNKVRVGNDGRGLSNRPVRSPICQVLA